jgi:hypothetical protein
MTKFKFLIMTSFLFSIFGCGSKSNSPETANYPKENFSVIQATAGNKPIIGSINMAYKTFDKKGKFSWCLKLSIALDSANLYENGLPKDEESKIATKLEDDLFTEIKKLSIAHYIGHLFNDTFLDVYIYLDNPEKVHNYLQSQINKEGLARGFGYEINQDPKWTTVEGFFK